MHRYASRAGEQIISILHPNNIFRAIVFLNSNPIPTILNEGQKEGSCISDPLSLSFTQKEGNKNTLNHQTHKFPSCHWLTCVTCLQLHGLYARSYTL